jgi:hypothetical protein
VYVHLLTRFDDSNKLRGGGRRVRVVDSSAINRRGYCFPIDSVVIEKGSVVMTSRPLMTADKNSRTLVLICRRDFCRMVDHVLRNEGLEDFQHGDLRLVGRTDLEARVGEGATEAFVIRTDALRAERLKKPSRRLSDSWGVSGRLRAIHRQSVSAASCRTKPGNAVCRLENHITERMLRHRRRSMFNGAFKTDFRPEARSILMRSSILRYPVVSLAVLFSTASAITIPQGLRVPQTNV